MTVQGKVTVGLASHWACVTDLVWYMKLWADWAQWVEEGR